jgi:predicted anti-sigma-YlaC factor YlaD
MNCPNPDLLSAFFDGEVDSPWSERIQEHVEACPRCQRVMARLRHLSQVLLEDEEPPVAGALERTRELLHDLRSPGWIGRRRVLWRKRVSMPVAAVAAMFVVILGLGGMLIFLGTRPNFPFMSIKRQPSGLTEVQVAAPIEDLEQLLRSLDNQPGYDQIIITLPKDTEFLQFGEPKMLRADEYSRRLR